MCHFDVPKPGNRRTRVGGPLVALALALAVHVASAQTAGVGNSPAASEVGGALNEIVVTATKRSETIQDVPISIQAITGGQLGQIGALDFNDFYRLIPGLSTEDTGPGDKRYIIRGINAAGPGTVGVYLDEAVITGENIQDGGGQQADVQLFDIQRVEVLKGPQGTTYGSSSLAGTIRYITNKPILNEDSATYNVESRSTKGADLGYETDGAANISVVPDRLAIRVAAFYEDLPGYIDSMFGKGVDGQESKAVRTSARLAIVDGLTFTVMAMGQQTEQNSKDYFDVVSDTGAALPPYYQADVAQAPFVDQNQIYNATLEYTTSVGAVTATASRFNRYLEYFEDASLVAQDFFGYPYLGAGRSVLYQPKHRRVDSYEARYASTFTGPVQVLAGVYAQDEYRNFDSLWDTVNSQGALDLATANVLLARSVDDQIRERSEFGEFSYQIIPDLKLTAGVRHYRFDLNEETDAITSFGGSPGSGPGVPSRAEYEGFIPRYNLSYKINENVNTYIQAAKGFRAGGNNDQTAAQLAHVTIPAGFAPDTLWNYEVGVKTSLPNNAFFFNAAVYYIDWSNIQLQLQTTGVGAGSTAEFPYTGNGGGAYVKGFETEVGGRPMTGLRLTMDLSYSDARLSKTNPPPGDGNAGDRLPFVPLWSGAGVADYEFPLAAWQLTGDVGGDITYTGSRATDLNATLPTYFPLAADTLVQLRAGVKRDQWSVMLIGNNVFNDQHVINYTQTITGVTPNQLWVNRPRTIAVRFSVKF